MKRFEKEPIIRKDQKTKKINLVALKSYSQYLEDKMANQIGFGCIRKEEGTVITGIDLKFENLFLKS